MVLVHYFLVAVIPVKNELFWCSLSTSSCSFVCWGTWGSQIELVTERRESERGLNLIYFPSGNQVFGK